MMLYIHSMHVYIHTDMHACIHLSIHTYIHKYIHICYSTIIPRALVHKFMQDWYHKRSTGKTEAVSRRDVDLQNHEAVCAVSFC